MQISHLQHGGEKGAVQSRITWREKEMRVSTSVLLRLDLKLLAGNRGLCEEREPHRHLA